MADDKNISNIERKEGFIKDATLEQAREKINRPEQEGVIEDPQKITESINQTVSDIKGEGEFGGIQPIGGFASPNVKRGKDIEDILSQDLADTFLQLSPSKQAEFKIKGEETAREINNLLDKAKFEVSKIIDLIKKWLFIIPGMNKFFIEQEAKIKADEIVRLTKI